MIRSLCMVIMETFAKVGGFEGTQHSPFFSSSHIIAPPQHAYTHISHTQSLFFLAITHTSKPT